MGITSYFLSALGIIYPILMLYFINEILFEAASVVMLVHETVTFHEYFCNPISPRLVDYVRPNKAVCFVTVHLLS